MNFRRFQKNISLRLVNFAGLSIVFACLLFSAGYIKREMSYDRHHANADRIVRLTLQFDNQPVDGRIWGNAINPILEQIPEIERTARIHDASTAVLTYQGMHQVVSEKIYKVNSDFLQTFDLPMLLGEKELRRGQILISESFARNLFGEPSIGEIISIEGGRVSTENVSVLGVFKDMPETSHFHANILLYLPDEQHVFSFVYLLLNSQTNTDELAQKITQLINESELLQPLKIFFQASEVRALLMPLTDIHLHSRNLRELNANGNIHYIYLIIGANALLLIVVLFNLWLNASLIFSYNRRYYQLLRLHGAPASVVFREEAILALFFGVLSVIAGIISAYYVSQLGFFSAQISLFETVVLSLTFLTFVVLVSLLPVLKGISYTLFLNISSELKPIRFSYSNVKYMFTIQFALSMIVLILAFGINKQMNLVKNSQIGGNERNILVLPSQPEQIQVRYELLKTELLRHTEIEAVTAAFQLPGEAIRDNVSARKDENMDWQALPMMIVGEDFLSFFRIPLIAGRDFSAGKFDRQTEQTILFERLSQQKFSEHIEEYIINRKALATLGINTPDEAIGQMLWIMHGAVDYFRRGVIVGVTDDFNYTGLYEASIPLLILQRRMFLHCIMVRLDSNRLQQARNVFHTVWNEVNPDFPADYTFMDDVFARKYRNEINAQRLVFTFALLCLAVAYLGLIVFMAFIIRQRTREIGIRKAYGASAGKIIKMLNISFVWYIALAFVIATPVAWFVMHRWLERFAYRTSLDWWIFALAGLVVLLVSVISVSLQSWRAANKNPVETIR